MQNSRLYPASLTLWVGSHTDLSSLTTKPTLHKSALTARALEGLCQLWRSSVHLWLIWKRLVVEFSLSAIAHVVPGAQYFIGCTRFYSQLSCGKFACLISWYVCLCVLSDGLSESMCLCEFLFLLTQNYGQNLWLSVQNRKGSLHRIMYMRYQEKVMPKQAGKATCLIQSFERSYW